MSLAATLANALSGLTVAQRALSVTAHNVANANTPGYSRKVLAQESVVIADRGAGVRAADLTRITDEFLVAEVRRQSSVVARSETVARYQDLLQTAFGAPGDSRDLAVQIGELQVALDALAVNPETSATRGPGDRRARPARAHRSAASPIRCRCCAVRPTRRSAARSIRSTPICRRSTSSTTRSSASSSTGQVNAELLDRRDSVVRSLAEKIDLRTYAAGQRPARDLHRRRRGPGRRRAPHAGVPAGERWRRRIPCSARSRSSAAISSIPRPACRSIRMAASSWSRAGCGRRSTPSS